MNILGEEICKQPKGPLMFPWKRDSKKHNKAFCYFLSIFGAVAGPVRGAWNKTKSITNLNQLQCSVGGSRASNVSSRQTGHIGFYKSASFTIWKQIEAVVVFPCTLKVLIFSVRVSTYHLWLFVITLNSDINHGNDLAIAGFVSASVPVPAPASMPPCLGQRKRTISVNRRLVSCLWHMMMIIIMAKWWSIRFSLRVCNWAPKTASLGSSLSELI